MSQNQFELAVDIRNDKGKGASRRLRREEKVPGVVYGGGKSPVSLVLAHKELIKSLKNEAFYSNILTLKNGSETERVILKALQRHPFKPRIQHVDFQRVRADEKLFMHIPLHFNGGEVAPGVKDDGGVISHIMSDVEISCLPDDLPAFLELDLSTMKLNDIIHLSDIPLPKGVEIPALAHGDDKPVVTLHIPRAEEVIEEEAPTTASPAEVPAISQKGDAEGGQGKK